MICMKRALLRSTRLGKTKTCESITSNSIHQSKGGTMSPSTNRIKFFLLFLALVCCCQSANAQGLTGQISGTLNDPNGGVVPNAKVEVINQETAQARTVNSDGEGNFVVTQLLPGTYAPVVSANGFKQF